MAMEDPQLSTLYDNTSQQLTAASAAQGDLLFAWLAPIGTKVDKRLRPKSPTGGVHSSPLTRARSAFRRTIRSGHVSHKLRGDGAYMATSNCILNCHVARSLLYTRADTSFFSIMPFVCSPFFIALLCRFCSKGSKRRLFVVEGSWVPSVRADV